LAEKHKITSSVSQKTSEINDKYKISEKASSVGNTISQKTTELDDKFKISEKVSAMNEAVSNATKKAMENETVAKGIGAFKVRCCETSHGRIRNISLEKH
jgi:hypothetical protein